MAKKQNDDATKSSPLKKLAIPLALVAGVFIGPKVMGGGDAAGEEASATTTTTHPAAPITLEPTTVNLADGSLLRVGIALQPDAEWAAEHAEEGEESEDDEAADPTGGYARALDAAVTVFTSRTRDQLLATGGRDAAKAELIALLEQAYPDQIETVYFHSFVIQ